MEHESKRMPNAIFLRLTNEEMSRVQKLADHFGLTPQNSLRLLIRAEIDSITGVNRQGSR